LTLWEVEDQHQHQHQLLQQLPHQHLVMAEEDHIQPNSQLKEEQGLIRLIQLQQEEKLSSQQVKENQEEDNQVQSIQLQQEDQLHNQLKTKQVQSIQLQQEDQLHNQLKTKQVQSIQLQPQTITTLVEHYDEQCIRYLKCQLILYLTKVW
jgi:hypothetical protein